MTEPNGELKSEKEIPLQPSPIEDLESQAAPTTTTAERGGISNLIRRWKNDDLLKRGSLASRAFSFIFSLLASIIMISNRHGDWREFENYEEYRYVLAIVILSTLYTAIQAYRGFLLLSTGREMFPWKNLAMIDFFGDQTMAYLLISSASAAVPLTNRMREGGDNIFTDASASALSMEFFAFFTLALSAIISGYKLANQTYI